MLNKEEKEIIVQCAKKYKVSSVYLFGSSISLHDVNDIDLAVSGIKPRLFFKFYGKLLRKLPKPVDLVDLSVKSLVNKLIKEKCVKIY